MTHLYINHPRQGLVTSFVPAALLAAMSRRTWALLVGLGILLVVGPAPAAFWCFCKGTCYDTEATCVDECTYANGLKCFGGVGICNEVNICPPPPGAQKPLPLCGGTGPSTVPSATRPPIAFDPVDVFHGTTFEALLDLTLQSSIEPVPFVRYYTSVTEAWNDTNYSDLYRVPAPFGKYNYYDDNSLYWWHNYYGFVTPLYDNDGAPYNQWGVRMTGGALLAFNQCAPAPCWASPADLNRTTRETLYYYGPTAKPAFMLIQEDGRRLYYGATHAVIDDIRLWRGACEGCTLTRQFLSEIRSAAGQTIATISYAMPTGLECPAGDTGSDPGVPYINRVTTADGNYLQFSYKVLNGTTDCAITSVATADGVFQAQYTYQTDPEYPDPDVEVGLIGVATRNNGLTGAAYSESYSFVNDSGDGRDHFIISVADGGTQTTNHAYTGGTGVVVGSTALSENLALSRPYRSDEELGDYSELQPSTANECSGRIRVSTYVIDNNICPGDGVGTCGGQGLGTLMAGMSISDSGDFRPYYNQTPFSPEEPAQPSSWMYPNKPLTEWACYSTEALTDHPIGQRDERGGWANYTYVGPSASTAVDGTPVGAQQTELQTITVGASSLGGSDGLMSETRSYEYGADGQQLLTSEQQASVLSTNGVASTSYAYDHYVSSPKGNRLKSLIRHGWTSTLVGSSWVTTERYVGEFYFMNHRCLSDGVDSLRRTLEVHGPCLVASVASTDCDAGGTVPITQYFYYAAGSGNASGKLQKVRQLTGGTPSNCASATYLETGYGSYDALGNPTSVTDPNGQTTTLTWGGSSLLSASRTGATWQFQYDHDKLTSIRFPQGNYELLCYRVGATGACSGGAWSDKLQWRARFNSSLTTWTERIDYTYWADGTVQTESYRDPLSLRRVLNHGANPLRQPTYLRAGDDGQPGAFRSIHQFNAAGDVTAIGFPFNDPPDFCNGSLGVSPKCAKTTVDRLGRLAALDQAPDPASWSTAFETRVAYDAQGNVSSITPGCPLTGSCSAPGAAYQYDDFGSLVRVTAPWLGPDGTSGSTNMEYDASGGMTRRQTPEMAVNSQYLGMAFDMLGRPTSEALQTVSGGAQTLFSLSYDSAATPDSSCPQPANTNGRLLRRTDSFGDTWYQYDAMGRVTKEIRLRAGATACSTAAPQDIQHTTYTWSTNGDLTSITYPFGRTVTYQYGNADAPDRAASVSVTRFTSTGWEAAPGNALISGIIWEPYGGLRAYIVDHQDACMPTYVNYRHVKVGSSSDPHTGQLGSLTVSTSEGGGGTGERIYRRDYTWQADQVTQTDTYLLGSATPRTETYGYDATLRLTSATGTNFAAVGGAFGSRAYGYDGRGNRTSQANEDCGYALTYGSSGHPDRLTGRASTCTGSMASATYAYDRDGRVSSITGPNDSSGLPAWQYLLNSGPDGLSEHGGLDSVYKSVSVNGAIYGYFYDAFNRRRAKQYPLGALDEFYYRLDDLLMTDVGNDSTLSPTVHPVDDYVWLNKRPVAVFRGRLDGSWSRLADTNGADCTRNGSYQACGTFAIVTDHIGAPVLMLDDERRVVGEGSMDPFGAVNRVSLNRDTAHPYPDNANLTLADFRQPNWGAATVTRMRAIFAVVDTEGTPDQPVDGVVLKDGSNGTALSGMIGGQHAGRVMSGWVTPSAGWVQAVFTSNGGTVYQGVALEGYEYQRYESEATPAWISLRYPGQYWDAESGLSQNWNRFLSPQTGRYLASEPLNETPVFAYGSARRALSTLVYGYARNNPLIRIDPSGLADQPPPKDAQGNDLPPPVELEPGKDGQPNSWVPVPGSKTGKRPTKWKPKFPVKRGNKGGQPGCSWDPQGHWDYDDGLGGPRGHFLPDGTPVTHERSLECGPGCQIGFFVGLVAIVALGLESLLDGSGPSPQPALP